MARPFPTLLALLLATACSDPLAESLDTCVVEIEPVVAEVAPGDVLLLEGGPFTVDWDTEVRVAGRDAPVLDVTRDECTPCVACRTDAGCSACGDCADCARECTACVQQVSVLVPVDTPAGRQPVVLFDSAGGSDIVYVEVLAAPVDTAGETGDTEVPGETGDTEVGTDTDTDGDTDTDAPSP